MAAYAALVSLAQTIHHILNRDINFLSQHQTQQIVSIHEYVIFLQTFLQNFPDRATNNLEGRMTDLANEAEDTIEYLLNESNEKSFEPLAELKVEIDSIAGEVMWIKSRVTIEDVHLDDDDSPAADAARSSSRLSSPSNEKDIMVGFDGDLMAIKERLCGQSPKLQIIPVVGMGGIGKTTLALNAYNDPLISEHFQIRAWATVSQDYSAQKVLSDLLLSMKQFRTGRSGESNEVDVYQRLKRRRYLIVMDDIWSTKALDDVKRIFPNDNNGSRVILTTRLSDVAAYAESSSHLHQMQLMGMHQSWDLLRKKVFKQQLCPPELESIGKEIARSCRGLPLAIVVVAGIISMVSKTPASWKKIGKEVNTANIATKDERFENIFSLSYAHLPHHLRACFLYMGAFPEDQNINVSKLIKLWVAEGFLKPSESKSLEETAEEYLEDLAKRFLVLVTTKKKSNGKIKRCRMHDVIRELCIRKADQEKLFVHVTKKSIKNQRRICFHQDGLNSLKPVYGSTMRTILGFRDAPLSLMRSAPRVLASYFSILGFGRGKSSGGYLQYFRFLRVLYLELGPDRTLLTQVFELLHLRCLAFSFYNGTSPIKIPAVILNLQNLQTLIIHSRLCCMVILPREIWRMRQLRHLICFRIAKLPNPEEGGTCGLENLQTLLEVENLKCSRSIMRMIPNIKKLGIYCSKDEQYELENLVHLQQLEKLKIIADARSFSIRRTFNHRMFPSTLKTLSLRGDTFPRYKHMMKIVGSLPNLLVLKLRRTPWKWKQWETSEGEFSELKYLLIENSYLEEWICESSHFPSLICLKLYSCHLREIPNGIGEIPTLELIQLRYCRKSVAESAKRIQEEQQSYGNDALRVNCLYCYS